MTKPNPVEEILLEAWSYVEGFSKTVSGLDLPFELKRIRVSTVYTGSREMAVRVESFTDLEPDSMIVVDVIVEIDGRSVGTYSDVYLDKELSPTVGSQLVDEFTIEPEDVSGDVIKEDLKEEMEDTLKGMSQFIVLILVVRAIVERQSGD